MSAEFVDTNILVYAYDPTSPTKHETARNLMEDLWNRGEGRLSIQVLRGVLRHREIATVSCRSLLRPYESV